MSGYEGDRLPCIARTSLEDFFSGQARDMGDGGGRHGSFVTLRKGGDLRGCIGYMAPLDTLYRQVYALARQAAFHDWRFPPLGEDELAKVRIEVSVLSPMKDIACLDEFVPSRDGILMTCRGPATGPSSLPRWRTRPAGRRTRCLRRSPGRRGFLQMPTSIRMHRS